MSIIEQIYDNRVEEELRVLSEKELDSNIHQLLEREQFENDERMANLFFEAGAYGQQAGFQSGFKIAIALLVECLG